MQFGVIGSGSWATALVKLLTDNKNKIHWWVRNERLVTHIQDRKHNPSYLSSVHFNTDLLQISSDLNEVVAQCDCLIIAVPSAYVIETLSPLASSALAGKKIVSAVKGILPEENRLLNDYLKEHHGIPIEDYFTIMGPCHAEEVASEKLSYLTFSGLDEVMAAAIASHFKGYHLNTVVNNDILGVQYAAVLKNIYAVGAGLAHGLEYGDNFLSVLIANAADEMAGFLQKVGIRNMEVGIHAEEDPETHQRTTNYAASAYLGDLLVTCYSPYSRNRTFGNMVGKGYPVKTAQLEMNMVAEGYNASKCMYLINKEVRATMPIAETIYKILWTHLSPAMGFRYIEEKLV